MNKIKLEFFHNITCGHCFIMQRRIQNVLKEFPQIELIHRAYPLQQNHENLDEISFDKALKQMEAKWTFANRIDEESRFNVKAMLDNQLLLPDSRCVQLAARALGVLTGNEEYWYDFFQSALFEQALDIGDKETLFELIKSQNIDFNKFLEIYEDPKTLALEEADYQKAEKYNFETIPAYVLNEQVVISGTKRSDLLIELLNAALEEIK